MRLGLGYTRCRVFNAKRADQGDFRIVVNVRLRPEPDQGREHDHRGAPGAEVFRAKSERAIAAENCSAQSSGAGLEETVGDCAAIDDQSKHDHGPPPQSFSRRRAQQGCYGVGRCVLLVGQPTQNMHRPRQPVPDSIGGTSSGQDEHWSSPQPECSRNSL